MANITLTMNNTDYDRITNAFLYTFVAGDTSSWTNQQKKDFVNGKVDEYVTGIVNSAEKSQAVAQVPNPTPPDISVS